MTQRGKFITVEGTEGVGKTTNLEYIRNWLQHNKIEFLSTREPGGTPLAEQLRGLLLQPRDYINGLQLFIALGILYGAAA